MITQTNRCCFPAASLLLNDEICSWTSRFEPLELVRLRALEASHVGVSIGTRGVTPVTSGRRREASFRQTAPRSNEPRSQGLHLDRLELFGTQLQKSL
jgi:hypothetical protein